MRSHPRETIALVLVIGAVALVAQLAGVGTRDRTPASARWKPLAMVAGGTVPDVTSTTLASTRIAARSGQTVQMRARATVKLSTRTSRRAAQVICGIRYSRDGDAGWSLGTPYETVALKRRGAATSVRIDRSFAAPARDTYRMKLACHVGAPATGAKLVARGTMRAKLGMPAGAARPHRS